jgi:hypothetical protein
MNFDQGNFNYDSSIDSVDFNILASKFGQTLPAPAAPAPAARAPLAAQPAGLPVGKKPSHSDLTDLIDNPTS